MKGKILGALKEELFSQGRAGGTGKVPGRFAREPLDTGRD